MLFLLLPGLLLSLLSPIKKLQFKFLKSQKSYARALRPHFLACCLSTAIASFGWKAYLLRINGAKKNTRRDHYLHKALRWVRTQTYLRRQRFSIPTSAHCFGRLHSVDTLHLLSRTTSPNPQQENNQPNQDIFLQQALTRILHHEPPAPDTNTFSAWLNSCNLTLRQRTTSLNM